MLSLTNFSTTGLLRACDVTLQGAAQVCHDSHRFSQGKGKYSPEHTLGNTVLRKADAGTENPGQGTVTSSDIIREW